VQCQAQIRENAIYTHLFLGLLFVAFLCRLALCQPARAVCPRRSGTAVVRHHGGCARSTPLERVHCIEYQSVPRIGNGLNFVALRVSRMRNPHGQARGVFFRLQHGHACEGDTLEKGTRCRRGHAYPSDAVTFQRL